MKKFITALVFAFGLFAVTASAQTPEAVVSWDVQFFQSGATAPFQTQNFTKSGSLCGQVTVPAPTGTVSNPTSIRLTDPLNASTDCVLGPNASAVLTSIPFGVGYTAKAVAHGATLVSPTSAASNAFSRVNVPTPPAAPANIRITTP